MRNSMQIFLFKIGMFLERNMTNIKPGPTKKFDYINFGKSFEQYLKGYTKASVHPHSSPLTSTHSQKNILPPTPPHPDTPMKNIHLPLPT